MSLSSLDSTRSVLIRYLDVPLIKPYLKEDGLLTDDEYERLQISPQNTSQDAVEKLVRFLKRKGPDHEVRFLSALKRSMNDQEHSGHEYIIQQLTEILTNSESLIVDTSLHELMSNGASAVEGERDSISRKSTSTIRLHNPPMAKKGTQLLRFKVAARTEQIMFSFVSLVLSVYHLLVDNNVPIEEVRIALMYLGCFRDKPFEQNFRMFNSSAGIEHATDHASLITCLHNYSSWFNYKIIKFLGEKFGGAEGLHLIAEYEKRLRTSIETLACYQCPDFSIERGIPPGFEKIDIKVDWDYHSCTASDIAIFERTVSELLGLEPHVWQLQSVDEGCVIMKWAVPGVLVETILCTVMAKREILKREKVIFVMVMGKHVEVSGKMDNKSLHSPIRPRYSLQSTTSIATVSSLSELTSQTDISTSNEEINSKRSSQNSALIEIIGSRLDNPTAVELEILSTYSGASGDSPCSQSQYTSCELLDEDEGPDCNSTESIMSTSLAFSTTVNARNKVCNEFVVEDQLQLTPLSRKDMRILSRTFSQRRVKKTTPTAAHSFFTSVESTSSAVAKDLTLSTTQEPYSQCGCLHYFNIESTPHLDQNSAQSDTASIHLEPEYFTSASPLPIIIVTASSQFTPKPKLSVSHLHKLMERHEVIHDDKDSYRIPSRSSGYYSKSSSMTSLSMPPASPTSQRDFPDSMMVVRRQGSLIRRHSSTARYRYKQLSDANQRQKALNNQKHRSHSFHI